MKLTTKLINQITSSVDIFLLSNFDIKSNTHQDEISIFEINLFSLPEQNEKKLFVKVIHDEHGYIEINLPVTVLHKEKKED